MLSGIAQQLFGDTNRWHEIFDLNRRSSTIPTRPSQAGAHPATTRLVDRGLAGRRFSRPNTLLRTGPVNNVIERYYMSTRPAKADTHMAGLQQRLKRSAMRVILAGAP
jgi:hypothetical protein